MGFFDFMSKEKPAMPANIDLSSAPTPNSKHQSFSTPFLKIGAGNLGSPYINSAYTVSGIVQFGQDNLYPQVLDQMYYTSAIHGACIDFITNTAIGGGYTYKNPAINGVEQVDLYTFEKTNKWKKIVRELTRDFLIHRRVCVVVVKDATGKFKKFKRLNPATVRNDMEVENFIYCRDWSRRTGLKTYKRYDYQSNCYESLYVYQDESVGQDIYPLPTYISVLNDVYLDGEIAFLQKSNIQNSIWPSIAVRVPKQFESQDEIDSFKAGLSSKAGAQNGGKIMVLTGNGMDDVPEVTPIATNQNDKLFDSTKDSIMNKICIAHLINPSIMGIKVAGSLGNAQELEMSYGIFEKNVITPLRSIMTEIFDELLDIAGIKNSIVITDFKVISPSGDIAAQAKTGVAGSVVDETLAAQPVQTNEVMRNMTGRQHQSMLRIIRQYGQGKLTKDQAGVMLRNGLGLSAEDIELMLSEE